MAKNEAADLLSTIGTIQTLIANFPMGMLTAFNARKYTSTMEFLLDALRTIGVTDKEILQFLLEKLVGLNGIDINSISDIVKIDDSKFQNNAFIEGLEKAIKWILSAILTNIVSCSIWPKIPNNAITNGFDIPMDLIDPTNLLNTCPTTENGKYLYSGISATTPSDLSAATDLNAFIWYAVNKADPVSGITWSSGTGSTDMNLCNIANRGYNKIHIKINEDFSKHSLFEFNRKYLNSIKIISPRILIINILNEFLNGLPNVDINFGITDIYNEAVLKKMIDKVVENDDLELNYDSNCYYEFDESDWRRTLEESELQKYEAKKSGKEANTAIKIDKQIVMDALNSASTAATLYDKTDILTTALYDTASVKLESEGTITRNVGFNIDVNSEWLSNLLLTVIRPIMKSIMTPKVLTLIVINYEIAGALNLSKIDYNNIGSFTVSLFTNKLMAVIAQLIRKVKDIVVDAVLGFFNEKVMPLINKYLTLKLLEKLEYYMDLLRQALDCVSLFGWPGRNNGPTAIDEVDYADITQIKRTPKSIC